MFCVSIAPQECLIERTCGISKPHCSVQITVPTLNNEKILIKLDD